MAQVVVVGGGVAGCAAALTARKAGCQVELIERMDSLSGLGPWTGQLLTWILRQEAKLLDGGTSDIIHLMESLAIHTKPEFDVPKGNVTFDVTKIEEGMRKLVEGAGIKVRFQSRVVDVEMAGNKMVAALLADGTRLTGDTFVDATGGCGGVPVCEQQGQGCVLCMLKCTIFGDRVSISDKCGVPDDTTMPNHYLPMPYIATESLSPETRRAVEEAEGGYSTHAIPEEMVGRDFTNDWRYPQRPVTTKIARLHPGNRFEVIHVPFAKCLLNLPLEWWRRITGFENAWLVQPLSGDGQTVWVGNQAPHENSFRVPGLANVFAGGNRAGRYTAFVEVMLSGDLAGHNAARCALGVPEIEFPNSTLIGYFVNTMKVGRTLTDWWGPYLDDPRFKDFASTDYQRIKQRMENAKMVGAFGHKLG
ncbi:MAG: FAD-dependent oxidoreductase [Chloroflexi bacterium]|nr:FAD-dependent oxidoreductase [Chloroflexota bacterium]